MSIESLLTFGLAAGLLGLALFMRTLVVGGFRMARATWRRVGGSAGIQGRHDRLEDALPRPSLRERFASLLDRIADAGSAVGAGISYMGSHLWGGVRAFGRGLVTAGVLFTLQL